MKRGDESSDGWLLEVTAAGLAKFTAHDSAAAATITGTTSVFDKWTLITVVLERDSATGLKIYVDGRDDQSTAVSTTALDLTLDGGTTVVSTGVTSKVNYLGPVGMYIGANAALSAATVLSNWNEGWGRKYDGSETGLAAAWNNDEGTGAACYNVLSATGSTVALSGTAWSPSKQDGSTAAITVQGPPFQKVSERNLHEVGDQMPAIGKFGTGVLSTNGVFQPVAVTFPQAIRCGRGNPLRILETDGAHSLILFGRTSSFS
jgi:hypothetical protein